jgi:UDP-glucose 4-epimerase
VNDAQLKAAFSGTTCLVTGGAGFIGSHLSRALLGLGAAVRVLDDLSTGHRQNLAPGAELVEGTVADAALVTRASAGCAYVFHLAAMVSVPQSVAEPERCVTSNIVGTQRVLSASRAGGVRRVVLASTCAVYGETPNLPSVETDPTSCCSPYAASKLAGEALCQAFSRTGGPSTACLRFFNVYGPGQDPRSAYAAVISAFGAALKEGRMPVIFGDGEQSRDFIYVGDIVRANLLAAASDSDLRGDVFNAGTGSRTNLLTLLAAMAGIAGAPGAPEHKPPRAGDVRHSQADAAKIHNVLGFKARTTIEEGLRATLAAM